MGSFILGDLSRNAEGFVKSKAFLDNWERFMGWALLGAPIEGCIKINYTGPIGAASSVYYALVFQLGKWEYLGVQKSDEWIDVSPVHAGYYQITQKQKEEIEARIKSGLASAAQATADMELLLHDKRKYEEMLHYMGYKTDEKTGEIDLSSGSDDKKKKEREKNVDNHSLKAMFVDQVDAHTGESMAIRNIVARWPTLISDFMKLTDEDTDVDKVKTKLDVSRAEAVILVTKNKLYNEWKKMFLPEVSERYSRIMDLVRSRRKSVEEYKKWLEPYIARHKMMKEALSDPGARMGSLTSFSSVGHPISGGGMELWAWKDFTPVEIYKIPSEKYFTNPVDVLDNWTKKNLIWHPKWGLVTEYPWITEEWVNAKRDEIFESGWMKKNKLYYSFFTITFTRFVFRSPQGEEIEDGTYDVALCVLSANAMLAKLLQLKAKQEELNHYVDEMLGIPRKVEGSRPDIKKERENPVSAMFNKLNLGMEFFRPRPYEKIFNDRVTKYILATVAGDRYGPIVGLIKSKIGYGGGV